MIIFEKIRWMNMLSTGNIFTEIDLNSHKSTLIIGKNGSGKCLKGTTEVEVQIDDPETLKKIKKFIEK